MYLTRRENGFRFQRRIPKNLEPILGKSPIRISLGNLPASDASHIARLLAGHSDLLFLEVAMKGSLTLSDNSATPNVPDPRDEVIAHLMDLVFSYQELMLEQQERAMKAHETQKEVRALAVSKAIYTERLNFLSMFTELKESYIDLRDQVDAAYEEATTELKRQKYAQAQSKIAAFSGQIDEMKALLEQNLDGGPKRPNMSEVLEEWHHNIRLKLGVGEKKTTTDYNRIKDFIAFAGDRPVNKYKFNHFQQYAIMLAAVPSNYNKKPDLRGMTLERVSVYNQNLPQNKQLPTLSEKTIWTNYFSPLQVFFIDVAAQYDFRSPLLDVNIKLPKSTKGTTDRRPFTVDELNKWFAISALAKQPDMKWMPLLSAFTGARVGELVALQGKDIYQVEGGAWVIDLTTDLIDADGTFKVRKVKNKSSRRIIALPELIIKTGFIDYVKTVPKDSNLFPGCFYHGKTRVKDPAGAASKRLNKQLKNAGIHSNIETTFHSTRHTAKDMMRVAKIDERTHDKQTGHSNKTVSRNYGAKNLLNEEIEVLRALPIPEGLDLSPYLSGKQS